MKRSFKKNRFKKIIFGLALSVSFMFSYRCFVFASSFDIFGSNNSSFNHVSKNLDGMKILFQYGSSNAYKLGKVGFFDLFYYQVVGPKKINSKNNFGKLIFFLVPENGAGYLQTYKNRNLRLNFYENGNNKKNLKYEAKPELCETKDKNNNDCYFYVAEIDISKLTENRGYGDFYIDVFVGEEIVDGFRNLNLFLRKFQGDYIGSFEYSLKNQREDDYKEWAEKNGKNNKHSGKEVKEVNLEYEKKIKTNNSNDDDGLIGVTEFEFPEEIDNYSLFSLKNKIYFKENYNNDLKNDCSIEFYDNIVEDYTEVNPVFIGLVGIDEQSDLKIGGFSLNIADKSLCNDGIGDCLDIGKKYYVLLKNSVGELIAKGIYCASKENLEDIVSADNLNVNFVLYKPDSSFNFNGDDLNNDLNDDLIENEKYDCFKEDNCYNIETKRSEDELNYKNLIIDRYFKGEYRNLRTK